MGDRMEQRVEQIVWRAEKLRRRRENYLFVCLSSLSFLLSIVLVWAIGATADCTKSGSLELGASGAVLLHRGGDVYVLIGIVAFTAGVIITILSIRIRRKQRTNQLTVQKNEEETK